MKNAVWILFTVLYTGVLGLLVLLLVRARREEIPEIAREPPLLRPFQRAAVYLYRRKDAFAIRRRRGKTLAVPGEARLRTDLAVLYPSLRARREEAVYRIRRIEQILLVLTAGLVFAFALHVQSVTSGILLEDGSVRRSPAGGSDQILRVTALPAGDGAAAEESGAVSGENSTAGAADSASGSSPDASGPAAAADGSAESVTGNTESDYGTHTVTVHARRLTRREAGGLADRILQQFPDIILGENSDPAQIRSPLRMPEEDMAAPFTMQWESSRYAVLDTDGSIFNDEYKKGQREDVVMTLQLTYAGYRFEKSMDFTVCAPVRSEQDLVYETIGTALQRAEENTATADTFILPGKAGEYTLLWKEEREDISSAVLLLTLVVAVLAWYVMGERLHEETKKRNRQLAIDYPQLTSRMVLYLGAGMSVRNVFYTCAGQYYERQYPERKNNFEKNTRNAPSANPGKERTRKRTSKNSGYLHNEGRKRPGSNSKRYLYEEMLLVCHELDSGVPEADAYMHFGRRCGSRQYTKLSSLLVQNLRRGNDTLLEILQREAEDSFEERKNLARELGEEAGTKLLLPMMIMLGITMLIIVVPAYFSFSG